MRSERAGRGGLTLVEFVVGLALIALVMAALSSLVFSTLQASSFERERAALNEAAQCALQRMAGLARETDLVSEPGESSPVGSRLTVHDQLLGSGADISFYLDGSRLMEGDEMLAEDVGRFEVRRADSSGGQPLITIELGLARAGASVLLTTTVVPRGDATLLPEDAQ